MKPFLSHRSVCVCALDGVTSETGTSVFNLIFIDCLQSGSEVPGQLVVAATAAYVWIGCYDMIRYIE